MTALVMALIKDDTSAQKFSPNYPETKRKEAAFNKWFEASIKFGGGSPEEQKARTVCAFAELAYNNGVKPRFRAVLGH